jgi:hypothetical protein
VRRFAGASFDVADGNATRRFIERVVLPAVRPVSSSPAAGEDALG